METKNTLAEKLTGVALQQMQQSWDFKLPRIRRIREYRRLYNTQVLPKLRVQFNVPIPVFAGMIDTLQADLNDSLIIKYENTDPADWKAIEKANAAIDQESTSMRPGAKWPKKFRSARFEKIITGRTILKFTASSEGGYHSNLEVVPFEDFFFEPTGGGDLDNHLYCGQQNIWMTKQQLLDGAAAGIYDKRQVERLTKDGVEWKHAGLWDGDIDFANRFKPLGLSIDTNNYVGEVVFGMCEWVLSYEGKRWYLLFEPYTGTWVRFEKNSERDSGDALPWMSSASHEDLKNFASKSFADDLYPIADSIITLFNQDLTNRQKRNLNAKAYDKEMFKDVAKLDEAQYRPDALVPADTKSGTKRISEGLYTFDTPELTGTVDLIDWLQADAGKNLGVTELQQGAPQPASKKVGVAYTEVAQIGKRLAYTSEPFKELGQQLGMRFFTSLKDYMRQPMAIKLLGERGIEWDVLRRIDLNLKRSLEIRVTSQGQAEAAGNAEKGRKLEALTMVKGSANINPKVVDEIALREVGGFSEHDIALLMDTSTDTNKETAAEVSAAIQDIILRGKMPKKNWNADVFFLKRLAKFARDHKDSLPRRKFEMLIEYMTMHKEIAMENNESLAREQVSEEMRAGMPTPDGMAPAPAVTEPIV